MKILYGIQGTGFGHISRARELIPVLARHASVDLLMSGSFREAGMEQSVKYKMEGVTFSYDNHGGISLLSTLLDFRPVKFIGDISSVSLEGYDLVISDYEPVTAWASRKNGVRCLALSHQAAFLSDQVPRPPNKSIAAEALLQYFAPGDDAIGFHFKKYDDFIELPVVRSEIRALNPVEENHITVYLPAFHHKRLINSFSKFKFIEWHIFASSCRRPFRTDNIHVYPTGHEQFLKSFESCRGIITAAGFETCAEAMYMNKKLMSIPIRNQYEQLCNAAALMELGFTVYDSLDSAEENIDHWLQEGKKTFTGRSVNPVRLVEKILG